MFSLASGDVGTLMKPEITNVRSDMNFNQIGRGHAEYVL